MDNEFMAKVDFIPSVQNDRSSCEEQELWWWKTSVTRYSSGMV
jgi:hypothetical protein